MKNHLGNKRSLADTVEKPPFRFNGAAECGHGFEPVEDNGDTLSL